MNVFWFLFGCFVGADVALTYVWLSARHASGTVVGRVTRYTDARKPW